jgi:hypothetical protein
MEAVSNAIIPTKVVKKLSALPQRIHDLNNAFLW